MKRARLSRLLPCNSLSLYDNPGHCPNPKRPNNVLMKLGTFELAIIISYFVLVLSVGFFQRGKIKTSGDFLLTDRSVSLSLSHWITGIAFMSANLGSLEIMGHIANGAKYEMRTNHWYWTGNVPAMIFCGQFTTHYYYSNGICSVPEYLRLRFDYRSHPLNALSFAIVNTFLPSRNLFESCISGAVIGVLRASGMRSRWPQPRFRHTAS